MRSKLWIVILSSAALLSGCAKTTGDFCDISRLMYFKSEGVVDYLVDNDPDLLRGIVAHNELTENCS